MTYGLLNWSVAYVPGSRASSERTLDHVADVLRSHAAAFFDRGDQLELRAERAHQLHALLAEAFLR